MANASGHGPRSPARDRTITWVKQLGRRRWKPRAVRPHLTTNLFANIIAGNKGVGKGNGSFEEGGVERITPEGKEDVGEFLSWLRRNGQNYRDSI